jgi:hypothetical protein
VTWIFVVAAVVALAIAVHFVEQAKARQRREQKRRHREQEPHELRWFSHTRQLRESWDVDFQTLELRLTRLYDDVAAATPVVLQLERHGADDWLLRSEKASTEKVPAQVVGKLEAQYQRFLTQSRSNRA